ncbi:MAG: tetratricopeptide repeat protein [Candidatus Binatia bacterium]
MPEPEKDQPDSVVSFGPYHLDVGAGQLWRNKQEVKVTPKAFTALRYFIAHPGQLVTKDDLFAAVWPQTVVTEATLASCIQELRSALRDDARAPRYIETVHRRGFRFIGKVVSSQEKVVSSQHSVASSQEEAEQPVDNSNIASSVQSLASNGQHPASSVESLASEPHSAQPLDDCSGQTQDLRLQTPDTLVSSASSRLTRSVVLSAVLLSIATILLVQYLSRSSLNPQSSVLVTEEVKPPLPLPDKPSLIVLSFTNMSEDPTQEYFSDGITEELTSSLSRIPSLFVIARHSAFTYKGKAVRVQEVSQEMGVRYVLAGSVRRAGERVRVTAQLIDATTGYHLWSERYDRPLTDIFAVQDDIVQKIVTTLQLQLSLQEQGLITRKTTNNLEAYDSYLRGLEYYYRTTKEDNLQARQLYEKAIALDPQYAEAYARLGFTYYIEWLWRWSPDLHTLEQGVAVGQRAVAFDDSLPMAHALLGLIYARQKQYEQALAESERAIALDPNNAESYARQAETLYTLGRSEEALRAAEHAMRLNPRANVTQLISLGSAYYFLGRYTEAISTLKSLLARNPNHVDAYILLSASYLQQWVFQQEEDEQALTRALAAAQRVLVLSTAHPVGHRLVGYVYLCQKQHEQALAEMEQALTLDPENALSYASRAEVLGSMGKTGEALPTVEEALRRKPFGVDDHLMSVGSVYLLAGKPTEAVAPLKQFLSRYPHIPGARLALASAYSQLDRIAEARAEVAEVLRINPQFSLEVHKERVPIKDTAMLERHIAALRKAGLK